MLECTTIQVVSDILPAMFFLQNFRLTVLTFRVTFMPLTFFVSRNLKFSLKQNFKQLNSIGLNLILKVK